MNGQWGTSVVLNIFCLLMSPVSTSVYTALWPKRPSYSYYISEITSSQVWVCLASGRYPRWLWMRYLSPQHPPCQTVVLCPTNAVPLYWVLTTLYCYRLWVISLSLAAYPNIAHIFAVSPFTKLFPNSPFYPSTTFLLEPLLKEEKFR